MNKFFKNIIDTRVKFTLIISIIVIAFYNRMIFKDEDIKEFCCNPIIFSPMGLDL